MARTIQVQVVKTNKNGGVVPIGSDFEKNLKVIERFVDRMGSKAEKAVVGYLILDTIRKVVIAKAVS